MEINQNIFRANDIRGIAYDDLTPEVVQSLGRALGSEAIDRNIQNSSLEEMQDFQVLKFMIGFLLE